jgi:hypothetical protein
MPPRAQTGLIVAAGAMLGVLGAARCVHREAPQPRRVCERWRPAEPPLATAPADQETADAVAKSGVEYAACPAPLQSFYLLTRPGRRELSTADEEDALLAALAEEGFAQATVGSCICPEVKWKACAKLVVQAGDAPLAPSGLAASLAAAGRKRALGRINLRLEVELALPVSPLGLRCATSDPGCGPIPHDPTACIEDILHPERSRQPIDEESRGACGHDGECAVVGCHQVCGPANERSATETRCRKKGRIVDPERQRLLDRALCGCVRGRCSWFVEG